MIEINLLPEELRKKKVDLKFDLEQLGRVKFLAGGIAAGILILLVLLLSLGSFIRKKQIIRLLLKEQTIASQKQEVDEINKRITELGSNMTVFDEITKRKFLWAKKINEISDIIRPGIWLTRIYTEEDKMMLIEGSVVSKKDEAMASVGKFMKDIREHGSFFEDFRNIKLESVQRKAGEERDVVDFKIALYYTDGDR